MPTTANNVSLIFETMLPTEFQPFSTFFVKFPWFCSGNNSEANSTVFFDSLATIYMYIGVRWSHDLEWFINHNH